MDQVKYAVGTAFYKSTEPGGRYGEQSASFHTTGNGETTSSSQAPKLPPNKTQEEIEQVLTLLLEDATVSLNDFTKARLE